MVEQIWIGLAEIRQRPGAGVIADRNEAFTNVLGYADGIEAFECIVRELCRITGFDLVAIEDSEPLEERKVSYKLDPDIERAAAIVASTGKACFTTLHTWTENSD